jgi:branched-chain amino acid transport system substrate-binding protein
MRRPIALTASLLVLMPLLACGSRVPHDAVVRANGAGPVAVPSAAGTASATPNNTFTAPGGTSSDGNTASSVGVTADQISVGVLSSKTSPLGPEVFSGSYYGATAYWDAVNKAGGIHGRKIKVYTCDDGGSGTGNVSCVHKLVNSDHVLALAGTTVFLYDGAKFLNDAGVDDVGGQPIGNEYDTYQHLWSIYGSDEPRNGTTIGWDGKLYGSTEVYRWFKQERGTQHAAVVFYNVAQSQRYAKSIEAGLKAEGYTVREEQVDLGLANFDSVAVDMASHHVDSVFDALDQSGNVRLCRAMDAHHVKVTAKVTTTQSWVQTIKTDFGQSPACRNEIYATGNSANYADTGNPAVAQFRDAMALTYPQREGLMSQWGLEGWAGAQWLGDAMGSCGANLTRTCIEDYLTKTTNYTGHGLLTARSFTVMRPTPTTRSCLNVARWQDSAQGGKGGWVTQVKDMNTNCFTVPDLSYSP